MTLSLVFQGPRFGPDPDFVDPRTRGSKCSTTVLTGRSCLLQCILGKHLLFGLELIVRSDLQGVCWTVNDWPSQTAGALQHTHRSFCWFCWSHWWGPAGLNQVLRTSWFCYLIKSTRFILLVLIEYISCFQVELWPPASLLCSCSVVREWLCGVCVWERDNESRELQDSKWLSSGFSKHCLLVVFWQDSWTVSNHLFCTKFFRAFII